jgi:serine/threonine-protein kinase
MITGHLKTVPPPPSKFKPEIPADLDGIILKCLEKNRDKRWASTAELRTALAALLAGKPAVIPAAPVPAPAPAPPAQAARWDDRSSTAKVDLPGGGGATKNKVPLVVLLVTAIVALLVGVGAVWYLSKHG